MLNVTKFGLFIHLPPKNWLHTSQIVQLLTRNTKRKMNKSLKLKSEKKTMSLRYTSVCESHINDQNSFDRSYDAYSIHCLTLVVTCSLCAANGVQGLVFPISINVVVTHYIRCLIEVSPSFDWNCITFLWIEEQFVYLTPLNITPKTSGLFQRTYFHRHFYIVIYITHKAMSLMWMRNDVGPKRLPSGIVT